MLPKYDKILRHFTRHIFRPQNNLQEVFHIKTENKDKHSIVAMPMVVHWVLLLFRAFSCTELSAICRADSI
jgi:accessory gene regulator protein AgrB